MNRKAKGTTAERELIHMFWETKVWAAMRAAGSGSTSFPSPDIVAGNAQRQLAIECKSIGDDAKYLGKEELEQLLTFARTFGAEPWIGIRFSGRKWFFFNPEDMKETQKNFAINRELAEMKGLSFEELTGTKQDSMHIEQLTQSDTEDDREDDICP